MDGAILLSSKDFEPISRSVIAALLYDIEWAPLESIDREMVESIYAKSIAEGAGNIIRSEATFAKLLQKLQLKKNAAQVEAFKRQGEAFVSDYFEDRFAKVISARNAAKIAVPFLDSFRTHLADHPELSNMVLHLYASGIRKGDWQLSGDALVTFEKLLGQLNGTLHNSAEEEYPDFPPERGAIELPASFEHGGIGDGTAAEADSDVELLVETDERTDSTVGEVPFQRDDAPAGDELAAAVDEALAEAELRQEVDDLIEEGDLPEGITAVIPTIDLEEEVFEAIDGVLEDRLSATFDEELLGNPAEEGTAPDSPMPGAEPDDSVEEAEDFFDGGIESALPAGNAVVEGESALIGQLPEEDLDAQVDSLLISEEHAEEGIRVEHFGTGEDDLLPESSEDEDDYDEETQLDSDFYLELEKEINEKLDHQLAQEQATAARRIEGRYRRWQRSGEMDVYGFNQFVLPIRGIRKIEEHLASHSLLHLVGFAGRGKSALIAAYLHSQVAAKHLKRDDIFYYRFIRGVSSYNAFRESLTAFVAGQAERPESSVDKTLEVTLAETGAVYVLDDLQNVGDQRIYDLVANVWDQVDRNEKPRRKLVLIGREKQRNMRNEAFELDYEGLSDAESNALVRDIWQLEMPVKYRREVCRKLMGNPQFLTLFRNWWQSESHADTQLERHIAAMPVKEIELSGYLSRALYEVLERNDSRAVNFLKSISLFRVVETEEFLQDLYERSGGIDFQQQLEDLVEKYNLLIYHNQLSRYQMPEMLKSFYYHKIGDAQMYRILHNRVAQLYKKRFAQSKHVQDATEAAYHFTRSDKEEEAAGIIYNFVSQNDVSEHYVDAVLEILQRLNFDSYEKDELRMHILYARARLGLQKRSFGRAEADFNACLAFELPDDIKAGVLFGLAQIHDATGDSSTAIEYCYSAIDCYDREQNNAGKARVYNSLIKLYQANESPASVLEVLDKAIGVFSTIGDLASEARASELAATIFRDGADWERAYVAYERTVKLREQLQDMDAVAEALDQIGMIHKNRGEWDNAVQAHLRVLSIKENTDDWRSTAQACKRIGNIRQLVENWTEALNYYQKAQKIYKEHQDWQELATVYSHIGTVYRRKEDYGVSLGYYQSSLELFEKLEDLQGVSQCYSSIAIIYRSQRDWERALDTYNRSLKIHQKSGDIRQTAEVQEFMADIFREMGQHEEALKLYANSAVAREEFNDYGGMADIFFRMGTIYTAQQDWHRAIDFFKRGLEIYEDSNNLRGMATTYQALGRSCHKLDEWDSVIAFYRKALEAFQELKDQDGIAYTMYHLGNYYHDTGDWERALQHYSEVLPMFEQIGAVNSMAQALGNISSIEFEKKDHSNAIARQIEILLYFQTNEKPELVERVLGNLVACHQELGADAFQPILKRCLDHIAESGISWGRHLILPAERASSMISSVFYNA